MPRYCAVKVCRNRGGTASRQENKRISFYPFPLQDKSRLQKWVDNMKREDWTPSRHQYLCSEHFTEDCFDIRWGIRYLKTTAVPTIFPFIQNEGEQNVTAVKRSPKINTEIFESDSECAGCDVPPSKKPLLLTRTCKVESGTPTDSVVTDDSELTGSTQDGKPEAPSFLEPRHSHISQIQTAVCEPQREGGSLAASRLTLPHSGEFRSIEHFESAVTVLCCESLDIFTDGEGTADPGPALHFLPVEMADEENVDWVLEDGGPSEGEHISAYEHSYCKADADEEQLWGKIFSLHAKISELGHREKSTAAKIHALETEIALLKRDSAVFKEKQKVLEDYMSSVLL